jgi:dTDP-4-amino-4,6-dideoxygalactose transaminase
MENIEFHIPYSSTDEVHALNEVIESGHLKYGGKFSNTAQNQLKGLLSSTNVELTSSCTAGLEILALALDLSDKDEIIVPTFTFCATATAFARSGAKIVLCDIDPLTLMIDPESVERAITPRTKAIVAVHYGGFLAPVSALKAITENKDIYVIEDAAQAFGALLGDEHADHMGDATSFSFHDTKIIGCGHGGALVLGDRLEKLYPKVLSILNRGTNFANYRAEGHSHYEWTGMGGSFRPTELECAILSCRLQKIRAVMKSQRRLRDHYCHRLKDSELDFLHTNHKTLDNGYNFAALASSEERADKITKQCNAVGIGVQSHYKPLHLSAGFLNGTKHQASCPNAESVWQRLIRLPLHSYMSISDVDAVCDFIISKKLI